MKKKSRAKFLLFFLAVLVLLAGCGGEDKEQTLEIAVIGTAPASEDERAVFTEVTLDTFMAKQDRYDALWVTKEQLGTVLSPQNKKMYEQLPCPIYFFGLPETLSGASAVHAVYEEKYEYDSLLFLKESDVQAQGFFQSGGTNGHFLLKGYEKKDILYEDIFAQIRWANEQET